MKSAPQRLLLHAFSTFKLGGPQARFVQLANAFGGRYRHLVMAMDGNYEAGERLDHSVDWQPLRLAVKRGGMLANRAAFRAELKARKPHLLLTYNWGAIEWAAANFPRLVPQVHAEDGFGPEEAVHQLPRRVWTRRILLGWTATPVVVASRNLQRIAVGQWRLPAANVRFVANGVGMAPLSAATRALVAGASLTIGTVAGLRPEKNVARLIRAFAAVRARQPARLVIVGDGPERGALEALAGELGVAADVEFTGYLTEPLARLATFDLFALSSNTEQLPISMLEAMACGVPVVATRVGDVPDVLPVRAHMAIAEPDDAAFEATLLRAIDDRKIWPERIAAGLQVVQERFSMQNMLTQWQHIFDCGTT